jgi:hypothetical protein
VELFQVSPALVEESRPAPCLHCGAGLTRDAKRSRACSPPTNFSFAKQLLHMTVVLLQNLRVHASQQ